MWNSAGGLIATVGLPLFIAAMKHPPTLPTIVSPVVKLVDIAAEMYGSFAVDGQM